MDILGCHGPGNDDAGAIAGKDKKLQTHLVRINSKAL